MFRPRYTFKPRYVKSNKKSKYARKRQAANVSVSRALYTKYRAPRNLSQTTEYPVRRMYSPTAIQSGSLFTDAIAGFRLNQLPDYTELTALYDQYRVDKLVFHFIPNVNEINYDVNQQDVGTLLTAVDFDGGATGLTIGQFLSYESCEVTPHCHKKVLTIKPRAELAAVDAAGTTISSGLPNNPNIWYDCSNVNLQFNGVRYAITPESGSTGYHIWYTLWIEAFVTFKNTR